MIARRFELVIFDCDGVLVDSEPIINRAHAEVLTACGYPITEKVHREEGRGISLVSFVSFLLISRWRTSRLRWRVLLMEQPGTASKAQPTDRKGS